MRHLIVTKPINLAQFFNSLYIIVKIFTIFSVFCNFLAAGSCTFPQDIRGRWFDGQTGEVSIRKHAFSGKGTCHQSKDNLYVTLNK